MAAASRRTALLALVVGLLLACPPFIPPAAGERTLTRAEMLGASGGAEGNELCCGVHPDCMVDPASESTIPCTQRTVIDCEFYWHVTEYPGHRYDCVVDDPMVGFCSPTGVEDTCKTIRSCDWDDTRMVHPCYTLQTLTPEKAWEGCNDDPMCSP